MVNNTINASDIAHFLDAELIGEDIKVSSYCSFDKITPYSISFSSSHIYEIDVEKKSLLIVVKGYDFSKNKNCSYIVTDNPKLSFSKVLGKFFFKKKRIGISESAVIHNHAKIGANVEIQENVIICANSVIGSNVFIGYGAIILDNCIIGDDCIISPGVVIGNEGLSSFIGENNNLQMMQHMGGVVLKNDVYIGANSTIGKGTINNTIIGSHTKVGPQVNIGHNTVIGNNCEIAGRATTCGSVIVGSDSFLGAGCVIKEGINIGSCCKVGIGAVLTNNITNNSSVMGLSALRLRGLAKFKLKYSYGDK